MHILTKRKLAVVVVKTERVDFKARIIIRNKREHFIMKKIKLKN